MRYTAKAMIDTSQIQLSVFRQTSAWCEWSKKSGIVRVSLDLNENSAICMLNTPDRDFAVLNYVLWDHTALKIISRESNTRASWAIKQMDHEYMFVDDSSQVLYGFRPIKLWNDGVRSSIQPHRGRLEQRYQNEALYALFDKESHQRVYNGLDYNDMCREWLNLVVQHDDMNRFILVINGLDKSKPDNADSRHFLCMTEKISKSRGIRSQSI